MTRQQMGMTHTGRGNGRNSSRSTGRTMAYVEGNTVRKLDAMPERIPREREEEKKQHRVSRQTRANRERAMRMNPAYMLFLTVAVILTVGVCVVYIQLQSEVNGRMRNVASLESQILNLKTDNDAALNRIEASVDMEEVKETAMNQLGMVYPAQDQIVYFKVDTNDYMNQYRDIPEK